MSDLLRLTCYRTGSDYATRQNSALAAAVLAPVALRQQSLLQLFTAAAQAGAVATEFRAIWQYQEFVQRVEHALGEGDLLAVQTLLTICPVLFSDKTLAALSTTIAANTLRLIDVVAAELNETAPATVTAANVNSALERAQPRAAKAK